MSQICVEMYNGNTTVQLPPIMTSLGNYPYMLAKLNGNELIAIIGRNCKVFKDCRWKPHSKLPFMRHFGAIAITMVNGIYVLGGTPSPTTSEFLPNGSDKWERGPNIPEPGFLCGHGCVISNDEFILTGGKGCHKRVIKFNTTLNLWSILEDLQIPRVHHRSVFFQDKLLLCGGVQPKFENGLESFYLRPPTEVISLEDGTSTVYECMKELRDGFGLAVVLWTGVPKVIAFGGTVRSERVYSHYSGEEITTSVEEWDESQCQWKLSRKKVLHNTYEFAFCAPKY